LWSPIVLSGEDVDRVVEPRELVEVVERTLASDILVPPRTSTTYKGNWVGVMLAFSPKYFASKIVGTFPENPGRGLPYVRGLLALFDASTGSTLLLAPAEQPTAWRTAAASALALRILGYRGGGVWGVIGAGVQARYHLRVLSSLYSFDKLLVYDVVRERAESLAKTYGGSTTESLEDLLRESTVVIAATTSRTPVVKGKLLREGAFIVSIGAPKPVRELDEETVKRAGCVLVDTREGVFTESDDVPAWAKTVELREAIRGEASCEPGEVRVYKSVGMAALDLAAAIHLYERVRQKVDKQ
jgi:alanine dehydrogenase